MWVGSERSTLCASANELLGTLADNTPLTVPSSLGAEAQAMSVASGFVEWATLFLQELIHGPFDLQGLPAVMQERPPVCVTDCKMLCDHLSAVGSPSTLHDKRSAIDVLIIRESTKKTGKCHTLGTHSTTIGRRSHEDKGENVERLRREVWIVHAPV